MSVRTEFLEACNAARTLVGSSEVSAVWDEPSALDRMTVGEVAGHLMRAVTSVDAYLDREVSPASDQLDAPGYFLSIDGLSGDLENELHTAVRARASEEATAGPLGVLRRWDEMVERLRSRLASEPPDRHLQALGRRVLALDEYLVTRLVEIVVHSDDLAVSVGRERPSFAEPSVQRVVACLLEVARRRHGSAAVVTALTRRERDAVQALRVL